MFERIKDTYIKLPISESFGQGVFTYVLFCVDTENSNEFRYEVKADSLHEALRYAGEFLNTGYSFNALDETSLEVYFTQYSSYLSYLFI